MALPLTSHESNLISQIQGEIEKLSKEFDDCIDKSDAATEQNEQEQWFQAALNKCKGIRHRSKIRESIIKEALNRMKNP
jgi:hypothetical protein